MLYSIVGFLITIGVLVTIHEWGHFIVARWCGVGVVRFSIGFGPILWQRQDRHGTAWALSLLPLGGYVKMVDERESPVDDEHLPFAYNRKPVWQRMAIVSAGPLANLLLAFLLFVALHLVGIKDVLPVLGAPEAGSRAALSGVVGGETVRSVNGQAIAGWSDIRQAMVDAGVREHSMQLEVSDAAGGERTINLDVAGVLQFPSAEIGLHPPLPNPPAVVFRTMAGDPAELAGMLPGDEIISINGEAVQNWRHMAQSIQSLPGRRVLIEVQRQVNGESLRKTLSLITASTKLEDGSYLGRIGIEPSPTAFRLAPKWFFRHALSLPQALVVSWHKTVDTTLLIPRFLHGIINGQVSWRHLNGPIAIADVAGRSLEDGLNSFVQIIAAISISLGVMNLLPLPVLDGGHLMFLMYEAITRRAPNALALEWLSRAGVTVLLMFMMLAMYNDISHYFR